METYHIPLVHWKGKSYVIINNLYGQLYENEFEMTKARYRGLTNKNASHVLQVKVSDSVHYTGCKSWLDFTGQSLSLPFTLFCCTAVIPTVTDLDQWVLRICLECRSLGKQTVHHLNGRLLIVVQKHDTRLQ